MSNEVARPIDTPPVFLYNYYEVICERRGFFDQIDRTAPRVVKIM
jgi:hypothetical protein